MIARIAAVFLGLAIMASSVVMFEAAGAAANAMSLIENARTNDAPVVRAQLLTRAERTISGSWARPASWHAGAAEALSATAWLQAGDDPAKLSASRDWAVRAIELSPVQPHAWLRLALLGELGVENPLCQIETCLARSWQAAPILLFDAECARLAASYRAGLLAPSDRRLGAFVQRTPRRRAAECLANFLPANTAFEILLTNAAP